MIYFKTNDIVHFITSSNTTSYGIVLSCGEYADGSVFYTVKTPDGSTTTVNAKDAYPSSVDIVTPTPTPTLSPSVSVTSTPKPTPTPTMTVTPSPEDHPNLFLIDATGWDITNGAIVASVEQDYIELVSKSNSTTDSVIFQKLFNVDPDAYYHFNLDYEQGTIRYAKLSLVTDDGTLFGTAQTQINSDGSIVFGLLGDSGNLSTVIYIAGTSQVRLNVQLYLDSNYVLPAKSDHNYRFKMPVLRRITNLSNYHFMGTLTPTPTATQSPTPSITPSTTPKLIPPTGYSNNVINDNPLIYYKFDEVQGNTTIDYSGNNINGQYVNAVLGGGALVNGSGYSVSLDGTISSSYVKAVDDNRYKTMAGDFSIELSLRTSQVTDCSIVALPSTFKLYQSSSVLYFDLYTSDGTFTVTTTEHISDNSSKIITVVRLNGILSIYKNATLIGSIPVSGSNVTATGVLQVGGLITDSSLNYNGSVDDFSLYRYGLTDSQVKSHYDYWNDTNNNLVTPTPSVSLTPLSDDYKSMVLRSSPLAYYRLDETGGVVAYDSIGGHHGKSNGQLLLEQPSLLNNYSDKSSSSNGNGLIVIPPKDFSFSGGDFTFEFFLKASSSQIDSTPTIFSKFVDPNTQSCNYMFGLDELGHGVFYTSMKGNILSFKTPTPINDDSIRLIHIIRNGRVLSIYINTALVNTISIPDSGILDVSNLDLELFSSSYTQNSGFVGSLDEFAIYNFALNSSIIQQHYNSALSVTPTPTVTSTLTPTPTPSHTVTPTISLTPSVTPTRSVTPTHSVTPTQTPLVSATPSVTPTMTPAPGTVFKLTNGYFNDFSSNSNGFYNSNMTYSSISTKSSTTNGYEMYTGQSSTITAYLSLTSDQELSFDILNDLNIQTWSYTETVYSVATTHIYIDGVLKQTVQYSASKTRSGNYNPINDWQHISFLVPAGEHTLTIVNEVPTFRSSQGVTYSYVYNFTRIDNVLVGTPPTPSVTPTNTPTPTRTPTITVTPSVTRTITPTVTMTPSVTKTVTPTISVTPSTSGLPLSPTPTPSLTESVTPTTSVTPSPTPTISDTPSPTPTITITPSVTPESSLSESLTPTPSPTITITPSATPPVTPSITVSKSLTPTPTHTPTPSVTPSSSVPLNYMALANNSPQLNLYKRSSDTFTKLTNPTLPGGDSYGADFSPDGTYLALSSSVSPYINIYKRSGDTFTKLPNPSTLPSGLCYGTAFSPDGTYLAIASNVSPYINIYKRSGDTFTKLSNPSTLPTGSAQGVIFSPDGLHLIVSHTSSPYITIYKRSTDTFTKLPNPSTLPAGDGLYKMSYTSDGTYLSVPHSVSPFVTIYNVSGDTFNKVANPNVLSPSTVYATSFSPDGTYLATINYTSPFIDIYKRSGTTFTKLADPATLPSAACRAVGFSPDGIYLAVGQIGTPYINLYKRSGDVFTKMSNPASLPSSNTLDITFWSSV